MGKAFSLFLTYGNFDFNNSASICMLKPSGNEQK